jgi:outer membrane protein assembly factor BamB/3',5'-cyclic AMP phosphodiesterase CpdA
MRHALPAVLPLLSLLVLLAAPARADFSFVHITDTHFTEADGPGSNAAKNAALYREISGLEPKPAFVVHTGDVCEIGTDAEYAVYRKVGKELTLPARVAPGNHDVRWNPRGKEGYEKGAESPRYQSWDAENVHFVLLDSTVLLQHWGHFDAAQLEWLAADLKKVGTERPVVIGFHHWIGREGNQVDNEARLLQILAPYNVRLFLIGHGHSDIQWNVNGTPAIMAKGLYQGSYHLVKVTGDALTVYRRTGESGKPDALVLTEPLARRPRPRAAVNLQARTGFASAGVGTVTFERGDFPPDSRLTYRFDDGKDIEMSRIEYGWQAGMTLLDLRAGFHLMTVTATMSDGRTYRTPVDFSVEAGPEFRPLWQTPVGGEVQGKLATARGVVFVPTMAGELVALDGKTGKVKWRHKTGGAVFSAPFVDDKTVYFGSADHYVYALDAASGKRRWRTETGGAVFAGASRAGNVVCIASTDQKIYGLDAATGKILWTSRGLNMYQSQSATDGERFFVGGWDNQFRCLDARTGAELWRQPFGKHRESGKYLFYFAPAIGSPTVGGNAVFITSNDGMLHALDPATGNLLWEVDGPSLGYSGPFYANGRIYNASLTDTGRVFCFDAKDGKKAWETPTGSVIYDSSCVLAGGKVFVGCVNSLFSCLDAGAGKLLWQYRLPPGHLLASPAADADRVYIGSLSGDVFAFPVK